MSEGNRIPEEAMAPLRWPLRLTRLGLLAERLTQAFWPVWSLCLLLIAAMAFGVLDQLPIEIAWAALMLGLGGIVWGLVVGIRGFHWPTQDDAIRRLDATLPGRPLAALSDQQAIGAADAASVEVWRVHLARMADRAAAARPVEPDLKLARRDPFALRYVALLAFVLAAGFGSAWRLTAISPQSAGAAVVAGPTWEGWVQPPPHTGKPSLYLNDIPKGGFSVPVGSKVTLRLYGQIGALTVAETVSGRTGLVGSASAADQDFTIARSGKLAIDGPGGRAWTVTAVADQPPSVTIVSPPDRKASGEMQLPFHASDDFGVVKGTATITLDLAAIDRRYGLAADPEPRPPIVLDLPMPVTGSRADFNQVLVDDLSKNAWANLPVKITLTVQDAAGQTGSAATLSADLPGRRFFDPLAAAVIEMRRDLLWSAANAQRTEEILRAITYRPEGFIKNQRAYLLLRVAMQRLETGIEEGLTPALRDEVAEALWQVALQVEDGTLSDALETLRQAQDKLSEAIRRGASKDEIAKLMDDMNKALQNYVAKLAQQQDGKDQQSAQNQQGQSITGDQMQQMLDRLQQLMEQGRMAEAQQLLDRLRQLTENMRVTQGQGGMQIPGGQAMKGLSDTLRQQQNLSDKTFQDLQHQFSQSGQGSPGEQPQDGQPGQDQTGQGAQGDGQPGQSLADRQRALRNQLDQQSQGTLPGDGTADGKAARDALGQAGQAMDQAEQALRNGDNAGALDKQAEAMDALRQSLHNMDQAMNKGPASTAGPQGQADGTAGPKGQSDPLGRQIGQAGAMGTSQNLLQGEDVYRRAREILDEIRKRSGDQTRPSIERDYLKRLLNLF
ncbi:MAG: TIGR02302 family protein [Rhodobacteraceae bacterium]|nr:TIGR02302 family protein [Paracoccaceae bacterium]